MQETKKTQNPLLSFILPCRNEELALPHCLSKIKETIAKNNYNAEIIVSDSSTDKSPEIAKKFGATVISHKKDGYGNAYLEGVQSAKGDILILGDADDTYDFCETPILMKHIGDHDLVLGQRKFLQPGSMPFLNRYIGNPVLSWILRFLFKTKIKDCHTGLRVIRADAFRKLNLVTTGMEFASEMIIKSIKNNFRIKEVPISYHPRKGVTKLNRFTDAWRHMRFMLLYSPTYIFLIPGIILSSIGLASMIIFYFNLLSIGGIFFYYHPMFLSSALILSGNQLIIFAIFAKTYLITNLGEESRFMKKMYQIFTIEKVGIFGIIILIFGLFIFMKIFLSWYNSGFGELQQVKQAIVAVTLTLFSIQMISSAFMLSILGIKSKV